MFKLLDTKKNISARKMSARGIWTGMCWKNIICRLHNKLISHRYIFRGCRGTSAPFLGCAQIKHPECDFGYRWWWGRGRRGYMYREQGLASRMSLYVCVYSIPIVCFVHTNRIFFPINFRLCGDKIIAMHFEYVRAKLWRFKHAFHMESIPSGSNKFE